MKAIKSICESFLGKDTFKEYRILQGGLINKTYLIKSVTGDSYILQQINDLIFIDVPLLMENLVAITTHFKAKIDEIKTKDTIEYISYYKTKNEQKYYYKHTDNSYWRLSNYIENTPINLKNISQKIVSESGFLFGLFARKMADIDLNRIYDTIPNFHITPIYYTKLLTSAKNDTQNRLANSKDIFNRIINYNWLIQKYKDIEEQQIIPLRLVHNDTKIANILFDQNANAKAIIDLDTCMPGYLMSDFGDSIRSLTNTGKEDDKDLDQVSFDIIIFKSYANGFLKATKGFILPEEKDNLALFSLLITYEQIIRFYTDYLNGDSYYHIEYLTHNLQRAKVQLKLLDDMLTHYKVMRALIDNY
jgi:hypothetical protein